MRLTARMGGNGFGNEFVKLAKLLVCRKELGIPIAASYWQSPYRHALPSDLCYSSRLRRSARFCTKRLIEFGKEEHLATGLMPVEHALSEFIKERGLLNDRRNLIEFTGFDPGMEVVESHGSFLHETLVSNTDIRQARDHRMKALDRKKIMVGVHIRRGDFHSALPVGTPWPSGQWNLKIPIEWYDHACGLLQANFPGKIQFFVTTNELTDDIRFLCKKYQAVLAQGGTQRVGPDVADLLALASCDALIGSASWFSGWSAVLQPKPWLWYGCAHGLPPWGKSCASVFVNEPFLPDNFLISIERILMQKEGL